MPGRLDRLPIPLNRRYHRSRIRLRNTLSQVIADARAKGVNRSDLLSLLLAVGDTTDHGGWSNTELLDQIVAFFVAGIETTANSLSWALHLLASHPDIQREMQAEADRVLTGATVGAEHLPRLACTGRVVAETLRLYPPGWLVTRVVCRDTNLGGLRLSAGTVVGLSPYTIHRRPGLYRDPDQFRPSRWINDAAPPAGGYLPFGIGARRCIGERFALAEMSLILALQDAAGYPPIPNSRSLQLFSCWSHHSIVAALGQTQTPHLDAHHADPAQAVTLGSRGGTATMDDAPPPPWPPPDQLPCCRGTP